MTTPQIDSAQDRRGRAARRRRRARHRDGVRRRRPRGLLQRQPRAQETSRWTSARTSSPRSSARPAAASRTFIRCFNRMNDLIPGAKVARPGAVPRPRPLRLECRPGRGAPADRDGLPEAEPVPEVDLRQHRLRPARARDEGRSRRPRRAVAARRPRSGTRSRTGSRTTPSGSRAVSSSASASRARSPSSPT